MKVIGKGLVIVLLAGLLTQGCAMMQRSPYGPATAMYSQGALQVTYDNTLFRTFQASRDALRDLDMTITNAQRSSNSGVINAAMRDGTDVQVVLNAQKPDLTDVSIRVGRYGLEDTSRKLSERIDDRLEG